LGQWRRLLRRLWSTCCGSVSWNVGCGNCGAVGWGGGGWGGGWTPGRCNNCGVSPLYVVNQGPVYTGPGLMQPYATYSPDTAYAPAANYPYVPGYGYGPAPVPPPYYSPLYYRPHYAYRAPMYAQSALLRRALSRLLASSGRLARLIARQRSIKDSTKAA
jgi:hypothetical protein